MTKALVAGALTFAATLALYGCVDESVDGRTSALTGTGVGTGTGGAACGYGGAAGNIPKDYTGVRGLTLADGTHAAVYRAAGTQTATEVTGTPFANPVQVASSTLTGSTPFAYVRHDGARVAVYLDSSRDIHEIALPSGTDYDFTTCCGINAPTAAAAANANSPVPDVLAYVRSDNRSALVYIRGSDKHVIEVVSNFSSTPPWLVNDLTALSGATVTVSGRSAFPYVRSDGTNSIVYIASDGHIHELTGSGTPLAWGDWDLTFYSGETKAPSSDPSGYRRSDSVNSVVFVASDFKLHELYNYPGGGWSTGILPAVSPSGDFVGRPSGYVRPGGVNAVAYWSSGKSVHEVELLPTGWTDAALPMPTCGLAIAPVFAHVNGNNSSILFHGMNATVGTRYELSQPSGGSWTLQSF